MILDLVKHFHEKKVANSIENVAGGDDNVGTSTDEGDSGSDHRDLSQAQVAAGDSVTDSDTMGSNSGVNIQREGNEVPLDLLDFANYSYSC